MVSDEDYSKTEKFKKKKGYNLNMVKSNEKFENLGLMIRPATYFYDSKGSLINQIAGGITKAELQNEIEKIIDK